MSFTGLPDSSVRGLVGSTDLNLSRLGDVGYFRTINTRPCHRQDDVGTTMELKLGTLNPGKSQEP